MRVWIAQYGPPRSKYKFAQTLTFTYHWNSIYLLIFLSISYFSIIGDIRKRETKDYGFMLIRIKYKIWCYEMILLY